MRTITVSAAIAVAKLISVVIYGDLIMSLIRALTLPCIVDARPAIITTI